ncbi:MAG: glycogen/starch/alpha-glucan phosphorylase, partial [Demequinaceae bacterium]|nr:glycogen/starch/alpha-glucan phosphorylase [Demequinaceae bacterium]
MRLSFPSSDSLTIYRDTAIVKRKPHEQERPNRATTFPSGCATPRKFVIRRQAITFVHVNENTPPVAAREHTVESFTREFLRELNFSQGVDLDRASENDKYLALAKTVRHYLMTRWLETLRNQYSDQAKTVAYLSAEFLLGPQLENSMLAADLDAIAAESLKNLGIDIEDLRTVEIEPGLGNGGLGRLAACFIDSLATLNVPSIGYGIRYEYGIFRQTFVDGKQVEKPDNWLSLGSPWEIPHPENAVEVHFGGHTEEAVNGAEGSRAWLP